MKKILISSILSVFVIHFFAVTHTVNSGNFYYTPSMLTVNNYFGVLQAVIHDLGIGVLPDYVTQEFDGVVPVLEEVQSNDVPVYLAFPEELRHSKRVEAFRDFVQSEIIENRKALRAQMIE